MSSYRTGQGYFINHGTETYRTQEADVLTCAHCQAVLLFSSWKDDGGFCRPEMKPLCGTCADRALIYGCEPFMKKLEAFVREQYSYSQFIKVAGLEPPAPPRPIITGGK